MLPARAPKAGHSAKHAGSRGVHAQANVSTHLGPCNVDSRATCAKVRAPSGVGICTGRSVALSRARLCQAPNATGNSASGGLTVAISGATGLIGNRLVAKLTAAGNKVLVLTREAGAATRKLRYPNVTVFQPADWKAAISGADAVVNLAGEPIATRWNERIKQQIMESRVRTTRTLVEAINSCPKESRPKVLVSSSAVGFYGVSENQTFDESSPNGGDFLSQVCMKWESEANQADTRVVVIRTGIVMATEGGALAKMLPIFEMFLGGPLGTGNQWMSWVHIDDLVGLVSEAITNEQYTGVYNGTAPNPVRMNDLCSSISAQLQRPSWFPVPAFALEGLLAEGAQTVLQGQRVLPKKAQEAGYKFQHPQIQEALKSML